MYILCIRIHINTKFCFHPSPYWKCIHSLALTKSIYVHNVTTATQSSYLFSLWIWLHIFVCFCRLTAEESSRPDYLFCSIEYFYMQFPSSNKVHEVNDALIGIVFFFKIEFFHSFELKQSFDVKERVGQQCFLKLKFHVFLNSVSIFSTLFFNPSSSSLLPPRFSFLLVAPSPSSPLPHRSVLLVSPLHFSLIARSSSSLLPRCSLPLCFRASGSGE